MKSSSNLFPVSLQQACLWDDLSEDIYLIKHNDSEDKSVEIALSRLGRADVKVKYGFPIILLHGSFSNKGFWLSSKGKGFARHLVECGFDVWMMELRGHGHSPINDKYLKNTVEDYVKQDLPAVQAFVEENTGQIPIWLGHSLGGVCIAGAVAAKTLPNMPTAISILGVQVTRPIWYLQIPFVSFALKSYASYCRVLAGKKLGIGPESEPKSIVNEYLSRHSLFGKWQFKKPQKDLMPGWRQPGCPLLGISGAADTRDPFKYCEELYNQYGGEKTLLRLGKSQGLSKNYGHVDMIVSKQAQQEVWPKISDWLLEVSHTSPETDDMIETKDAV